MDLPNLRVWGIRQSGCACEAGPVVLFFQPVILFLYALPHDF